MIAAIYARVSTEDQDCSMQLSELREYVKRNGWEIVELRKPAEWDIHQFRAKVLKDKDGKPRPVNLCARCGFAAQNARHTERYGEYVENMTGTKGSRPELDRLKQDARERRFDVVVTWKLDRFGRSVEHLMGNIRALDECGIRFICPTQGIDTDQKSAVGRLLLHIMAAFAEFERALIVERVRSGVAEARRQGKHCGRPKKIFRRDTVVEMRRAGKSWRVIAAELGVPVATVRRAV